MIASSRGRCLSLRRSAARNADHGMTLSDFFFRMVSELHFFA
jgi:hypothetical protein